MQKETVTTYPPDEDKHLILIALQNGLGDDTEYRTKIFDALNRLTIGAWRYEEMRNDA